MYETANEMLDRANERVNDARSHPYGSQHAAAAFAEAAAMANISAAKSLAELVGLIELGQMQDVQTRKPKKAKHTRADPAPAPVELTGEVHPDYWTEAGDYEVGQEAAPPVDVFAEAKAHRAARRKN